MRAAACLGAVLLCAQAYAQDTVRVAVEAYGNGVRVAAEVDVRASRAVAWKILSDYDRWAEFMPELKVSRVVSREPLRVEQRGGLSWLPGLPIVVVADVVETPGERVHFKKIQGNVAFLEGEWRLSPVKGGTRVAYRAVVEPGFPLPVSVSLDIFREDTRAKVEAMAQEIMRQARNRKK